MKIKQLQQGGAMLDTYTPWFGNQQSSGASAKASTSDDSFLTKDVIKMLSEKGLMNDVSLITNSLYQQAQYASNNPELAEQLHV